MVCSNFFKGSKDLNEPDFFVKINSNVQRFGRILVLVRARIAAKAEEKKLELLFLWWSEHHRKLGNVIRTKADPPIYYLFAKPMNDNATLLEEQKEQQSYSFLNRMFQEWKASRREELSQYQNQIAEWYVGNVDKELGRWQNGRKGLKANNDMANLQETMDKEFETHQLEHGPKTRKIPGGSNNDDEDDVEVINVVEDDMMCWMLMKTGGELMKL
ncbi:ATP-dependent Clp protease ATP-binding subunit clpA homolog CD4B, chloroplastic [Olea europaea subsp. europaea]|uniref:ATP-dependent Clp protease ATP-binding subunit clpA homolog CD4B, chloroplastic n=1 Tax=Olea europaea subsp. europaea TaxID=158383 RepID=A0A8S0RTS6_OLEEU|nr:ATP-dependent Clp protease ATP-binding subunit clpA homolog CD4B, chloroplastic [Olea europaea subsp. europaea]